MKLIRKARAGTLESGDVFVTVEPSDRLEITLESPVREQFGEVILGTVHSLLDELEVTAGLIGLADQGALDCTIVARLTTALRRASEEEADR